MEGNAENKAPDVIEIDFRMDPAGAHKAEQLFKDYLADGKQEPRVILDMTKTAYLGSTGVRVLLTFLKQIRLRNGALALCGLNPSVEEVFNFAGLETLFAIHPDRAAAIAAMQGA